MRKASLFTIIFLLCFVNIFSFTFTVKTKIVTRAKNRVNVAWIGDGYAVADTASFLQFADSALKYRRGLSAVTNNALAMRPFVRYDKFFNFYQVNLVSPQSGISATPGWGIPDTFVINNALGGTHDPFVLGWCDDIKTAALLDTVKKVMGDTLHWKFLMLNINGYYNAGGLYPTFAYPQWNDIANHECGHSFHNLADEYFNCDASSDFTEYSEINSTPTLNSTKWLRWVGYKDLDPLVAVRVGTCGTTGDTVSYYAASRYVQNGQYRPTANSKMGWTGGTNPVSYNIVSREKIVHDIYTMIKPIDTLRTDTGAAAINNADSVWVRVIDTAVLGIDWYNGSTLKDSSHNQTLKRNKMSYIAGTYQIKAHVYDRVIRHMNSPNATPSELDLVRADTSKMFQDARWTVTITNTDSVGICLDSIAADTIRLNRAEYRTGYNMNKPVRSLVSHFYSPDTVYISKPITVRDSLVYDATAKIKTLAGARINTTRGYNLIVKLNGVRYTPTIYNNGSKIFYK